MYSDYKIISTVFNPSTILYSFIILSNSFTNEQIKLSDLVDKNHFKYIDKN